MLHWMPQSLMNSDIVFLPLCKVFGGEIVDLYEKPGPNAIMNKHGMKLSFDRYMKPNTDRLPFQCEWDAYVQKGVNKAVWNAALAYYLSVEVFL